MEYLITDISELTAKKRLIFINYEPAFALYATELHKLGLRVGEQLPADTYDDIVSLLSKRALTRALHLFKDRDYTEHEARKKLSDSYYPQLSVDYAIEYLSANHFIDDDRYAYNFICFRIDKLSRRAITGKLQQKGVAQETIERAFEHFSQDNDDADDDAQHTALLHMLEKRLKGQNPHDLSYEDRQKLFAYMYRKGFAYDACSKAFDELSQIP